MASLERKHLWSLGLFVLPLIAVKLAGVLFGGVPRPAHASGDAMPAVTDPSSMAARQAEIQWTPRQRAAGEYVTRLSSQSFGPTPLLYTSKPTVTAPPVPTFVPIVPAPQAVVLPHLRAVMTTNGVDKALIDNQFYQVGEQIRGTPFRVRAISIDGRSATLAHTDGTTVTIMVQGP